MENPFLVEYDTPFASVPFNKIKGQDYENGVICGIEEAKREIDQIVCCKDLPTFENTILALEKSGSVLRRVTDVFFNIKANEEKLLEYTIKATNLALGTYSLGFSVGLGNAQEGETNFDVVHHVLSFDITRISFENNTFFMKWEKSWGYVRFNATMREL